MNISSEWCTSSLGRPKTWTQESPVTVLMIFPLRGLNRSLKNIIITSYWSSSLLIPVDRSTTPKTWLCWREMLQHDAGVFTFAYNHTAVCVILCKVELHHDCFSLPLSLLWPSLDDECTTSSARTLWKETLRTTDTSSFIDSELGSDLDSHA